MAGLRDVKMTCEVIHCSCLPARSHEPHNPSEKCDKKQGNGQNCQRCRHMDAHLCHNQDSRKHNEYNQGRTHKSSATRQKISSDAWRNRVVASGGDLAIVGWYAELGPWWRGR